jgi:hypothetical protein
MIKRGTAIGKMLVAPAEAGIQRLESLEPGQKHAGMTNMWDSNGLHPIILNSSLIRLKPDMLRHNDLEYRYNNSSDGV